MAGGSFVWLRGWGLGETARFANAVGGPAATAVGTTRGVGASEERASLVEGGGSGVGCDTLARGRHAREVAG